MVTLTALTALLAPAYFAWRMLIRHDKFIDAILFPLRWLATATGCSDSGSIATVNNFPQATTAYRAN